MAFYFIFFFTITIAVSIIIFYLPYVLRVLEQYRLKNYCKKLGILVLTYDDGPGHRLTDQLLNIFIDENVNVTFFFVGKRAGKHPEIVYRAMNDGHEIGFHGYDHINYWKVSCDKALSDIGMGYQSLSFAMKNKPIFRPPFGKLTLLSWMKLKNMKIKIGYWTYASRDTYNHHKSIDNIIKDINDDNGGVILLHDYDRTNDYIYNEIFVIDLTIKLIQLAKQNQWRILKLGDLIH